MQLAETPLDWTNDTWVCPWKRWVPPRSAKWAHYCDLHPAGATEQLAGIVDAKTACDGYINTHFSARLDFPLL